ncbi:hypothetical protein QBZ16_003443 [Prototheca wickerhamii]|uniref:homogentisate 1,2-dioxygenase n=1 Tax=Prototheca wickerhamii TaxID=3111 RepID=A0AAD9MLS4_PROWI|nr:hypothetical protein QBZ16_003443 [Prototheca wickerhamii]
MTPAEDDFSGLTADFASCEANPEQLSAATKDGYAIHWYTATKDMVDSCLTNADGELLIVPQQGGLLVLTEFGKLCVRPGEIVVVPRGARFSVQLLDEAARGYVLEVFSGFFKLPDLGPIGANGLANARDFEAPVAWYENRQCDFTLLTKFEGRIFEATQDHSPFDVVAWHGNLAPYKYDLARFCPMNAVSFDHPDPSIFTVLTCPSATPGVAIADFVIFPPRWAVAEHTFRPPYFHRNVMSEFMGLIRGQYDAKAEGFAPGGSSLHSCMSAHGPDVTSHKAATAGPEEPAHLPRDTLAFMFET